MKKSEKVDAFLLDFDNPLVEEIKKVREIILTASDKIEEDIKWGTPNFAYKENMATFNPRAKKFVNLTFHKGALLNDKTGLLEGDKKEARVARFYTMEDVAQKKEKLITVVKAWIKLMDESK
jgi:hypothetical protein